MSAIIDAHDRSVGVRRRHLPRFALRNQDRQSIVFVAPSHAQ